MRLQSLIVVFGLLTEGTQAYAPIQWMKVAARELAVMPKGFPRNARSSTLPQDLMIGEPVSPSKIPDFTANIDHTITWDEKGWCIEASGQGSENVVRVNVCTGKPAQKWNWIPDGHGRNMIQLKDTNKCLHVADRSSGPIGAPLKLQECEKRMTDSWKFGALTQRSAPSRKFRNLAAMISLITLAGAGLLRLGINLQRWQNRARMFSVVGSDVPIPIRVPPRSMPSSACAEEAATDEGSEDTADAINKPNVPHIIVAANDSTKWLVVFAQTAAVVLRHDLVSPFIVIGSIAVSFATGKLKKIINQQRPEGAPAVDPGMPSSHALVATFIAIAWALHFHTFGATLALGIGALTISSLRVAVGYHTCPQVMVGGALGATSACAWMYLGARLAPLVPWKLAAVMLYTIYVVGSIAFMSKTMGKWYWGKAPSPDPTYPVDQLQVQ